MEEKKVFLNHGSNLVYNKLGMTPGDIAGNVVYCVPEQSFRCLFDGLKTWLQVRSTLIAVSKTI